MKNPQKEQADPQKEQEEWIIGKRAHRQNRKKYKSCGSKRLSVTVIFTYYLKLNFFNNHIANFETH